MEIEKTFCDALRKRIEKTCEIIKEKTGEDLKIDKDIEIICGNSNNLVDNLNTDLHKILKLDYELKELEQVEEKKKRG